MLEGEALNKAVAEALGWTGIYWEDDEDFDALVGISPSGTALLVPDWDSDLNLTIEVIKNVIPFQINNLADQTELIKLQLNETHYIKWKQIAPILLNRWLDVQKRWKAWKATPADET